MRLIAAMFLAVSLTLGSMPALAAMSLDQAVRVVKRQTDGRVLSARTVRRGDRLVHRIKILTPGGHVRVITIDGGRVDKRGDGGRPRR